MYDNSAAPLASPKAIDQVILLHGLHMHAFAMWPMANRLRQQGFDCHRFGYHSVLHPVAKHSERLNQWLLKHLNDHQAFHLVGHSLGGLVIRDFLQRYPSWVAQGGIGRVVTLGTPHVGSVSAERLIKWLPLAVGRAYQGALDGQAPALISGIELGVVAGNRPKGMGYLIMTEALRRQENDGSVLLSETRLPEAKDHITLPHSHTGMLLSHEVADQVVHFLQHGKFHSQTP